MVEESGVKWSIEHFHEGIVMSWGPQTSNLQTSIADYTPKPPICQTFYVQNSVQKCTKNVQNIQKKYRKVWKISRKPGKKVCYRNVFYTRGFDTTS
jgi:hypothetical protein